MNSAYDVEYWWGKGRLTVPSKQCYYTVVNESCQYEYILFFKFYISLAYVQIFESTVKLCVL